MPILMWFLSPIGKVVGSVLILLAIVGGIYLKGRLDASASIKENIQREGQQLIQKADRARSTATRKFDAGRLPDDGFARD